MQTPLGSAERARRRVSRVAARGCARRPKATLPLLAKPLAGARATSADKAPGAGAPRPRHCVARLLPSSVARRVCAGRRGLMPPPGERVARRRCRGMPGHSQGSEKSALERSGKTLPGPAAAGGGELTVCMSNAVAPKPRAASRRAGKRGAGAASCRPATRASERQRAAAEHNASAPLLRLHDGPLARVLAELQARAARAGSGARFSAPRDPVQLSTHAAAAPPPARRRTWRAWSASAASSARPAREACRSSVRAAPAAHGRKGLEEPLSGTRRAPR